mmetsp:Transcript_3225/g.10918  ORF Transcript_3225/g.10918 Transcript_3225/m.10918 type:complete len:255 (-) Transcript_3225:1017-1781(-)
MPLEQACFMYSCCSLLVTGPTAVLMALPSISETGRTPLIVPVVNASSHVYTSAKEMFLSSTSIPSCLATLITLPRVMPGRQLSGRGVRTTWSRTMKKFVALVSDTNPWLSSMSASSTSALLAWILARMLLRRLLWWILLSRNAGEFRRMLELMSRCGLMPDTFLPDESMKGFHSASTMRHESAWLFLGLIPDVTFSPLVSVSRMCVSLRMPLAWRVSKTARLISSFSGTCSNSRACAESCSRCMCSSKSRMTDL